MKQMSALLIAALLWCGLSIPSDAAVQVAGSEESKHAIVERALEMVGEDHSRVGENHRDAPSTSNVVTTLDAEKASAAITVAGGTTSAGADAVLSASESAGADAAPVALASVSALPARVAALEEEFAGELAGLGLELGRAEVQRDLDLTEVTLVATAGVDLSRSGRLLHRRQHVLLPGGEGRTVLSEDTRVDVDVEKGVVEVTSSVLLGDGIGDDVGQPELAGLKMESVLAIPLEEYRRALSSPAEQEALAQQWSARQQDLFTITVTGPDGRSVSFKGAELSLEEALGQALGISPFISPSCIIRCVARLGRNIGLRATGCLALALGRCADLCASFPGQPCVGCVIAQLIRCRVPQLIQVAQRFAECIRGCF